MTKLDRELIERAREAALFHDQTNEPPFSACPGFPWSLPAGEIGRAVTPDCSRAHTERNPRKTTNKESADERQSD